MEKEKLKRKDIPYYLPVGANAISQSLDGIRSTLERFSDSYGLDLDPDFQRGHVWTPKNKTTFIEHIIRGGSVPPLRFNSPVYSGHPQAKNSDLGETIILVDGKQRLTAVLEFLEGKISVFDGYYLTDIENHESLLRGVDIHYLVNRLQTKRELLMWYLQMNEGNIPHSVDELDRVREMIAVCG